jgi:flavin-dependent dehydrogenase
MDRAFFPRDKPCAGWITPQVLEELELAPDEYAKGRTLQPIHGFSLAVPPREGRIVQYGGPVSWGVRRSELDAFLLQRSEARLRLGQGVESVRRVDGGWIVNDAIRAPVLVGAGGHGCPVVRALHRSPDEAAPFVSAKVLEFALDARAAARCAVVPELPQLYFSRDLRGYGWAARKGDVLTVGLGRQGPGTLAADAAGFLAFLEARGVLPPGGPREMRGHDYLAYGRSRRPLVGEGVLLVGDAAGFADPRSGEGIRPAVESGLLAAAAIVRADGAFDAARLRGYEHAVRRRFGARDSGQGWRLAPLVPPRARARLAGAAVASRWFDRHVVLDRWLLHRGRAALAVS